MAEMGTGPLAMKADRQETESRHFVCPKSYVAKDGREILFREDWLARKLELYQRAEGRCEHKYMAGRFLIRCSAEGVIPAHIIPRKDMTQRDDRLTNLKWLCVVHDRLTEGQSWRRTRFGEKAQSS